MRTFFLGFLLYFSGFSMYFSKFQVIFQNLHILPNIIFLEFWSIFPNHQFFPDSFTKIKWGPFLFLGLTGLKKNIFCIFLKLLIFFTFGVFFGFLVFFRALSEKRCKQGSWGLFSDYGWTSLNFDWTDWVSIRFHRLVVVSCCDSCCYGHIWILCAYYASCVNNCTEHEWFYQLSYWDPDKTQCQIL